MPASLAKVRGAVPTLRHVRVCIDVGAAGVDRLCRQGNAPAVRWAEVSTHAPPDFQCPRPTIRTSKAACRCGHLSCAV